MDRYETVKILSSMRAAYPAFYKGMNRKELESIVNLWAEMFVDDSYEIVGAAVKALISSDEKQYRPPHIGAVKSYIQKITNPQEMTDAEAWSLVVKATSNSIYDSEKEFDKLPKIIQSLVGSPSQLKDWAMMESKEFQTVIASNFQRSYRSKAESEKEIRALPSDVRTLVDNLSGRFSLKSPSETK